LAAPEEEEFVYHAHRPGQPMDPAIRKMALGAGGVSVLVIVVALLWGGVRATGFGPPPVISAPPGPIRVLPSNPGGLTVPGADVQIMSGDDSSAPPQLAPAGAAPEISQLDQAAGVVAPAPAPVAPPPVAAPDNAPAQVQLAATADEPGAESVWNGLKAKMPDLFSGKTPEILPAVVNGQSIWRLRLGGFADADDAKAFCASVKAKGADCTVAAF
jgi:cell division septation protein DedD